MRLRRALLLAYVTARGHPVVRYRREYKTELARGSFHGVAERQLHALLDHARRAVPYYRAVAPRARSDENPVAQLRAFPILTKDIIRSEFKSLLSSDLDSRHWYYNTSGGSTGEPTRLVQDREYADRSAVLTSVLYERMGFRSGDRIYTLWGSEREILQGSVGLRARVSGWIHNATMLNAFRMTPEAMRAHLQLIARRPPGILICYAQALYELARFAEEEGISVPPQRIITSSAGTLHPFMREVIERFFGCPVFNWYGSREVGAIATQLPGEPHLWVPPWAQYVEILDEDGRPAPDGVEGEIVVTLLLNNAMPLIRYRIGDRGALAPPARDGAQRLLRVSGRNVDVFRKRDGTLIDGEYFTHVLYFRDWVRKFQLVQTDYECVTLKVVPANGGAPEAVRQTRAPELAEVEQKIRAALGPECVVDVQILEDIPPAASGKYRYTISALGPRGPL